MRAQSSLFVAVALAAVAVVAPSAQRLPQDYPQWRGQQRDGAASGFVEPGPWPRALTKRWQVEVGEGYGTPLIVGDVVYVFTRRDGNESAMAIDARTGVERWRSIYPAPYTPSQPAAAHGAGPKATPLFHADKLFTVGISGIVTAFDAGSGKRLWQTAAPAEHPFYGGASSPLGEQGLVIVHPGNYGPLTAFDVDTGALKWSAGGGGFFASPIIVTLEKVRQVVSATQDAVIGVSLDGRVLWRYPFPGGNGSTTPVLSDDTIVVSSPDGMVAIKPSLRDGAWTAEAIWNTKDVSMYLSNPVVVQGTLYGLSTRSRGQFFAIDAKTGGVLWLGSPREAENTAVVKSGNLLFLLNDDGKLIVAKASRSGFEPVARYTVADSATWAQPTISGNRLFVKDVASLSLWTFD